MGKESLSLLELEDKMFNLQARMINIGIVKGLTHPDTVKCSQELDVIINNLQNMKSEQHAYNDR